MQKKRSRLRICAWLNQHVVSVQRQLTIYEYPTSDIKRIAKIRAFNRSANLLSRNRCYMMLSRFDHGLSGVEFGRPIRTSPRAENAEIGRLTYTSTPDYLKCQKIRVPHGNVERYTKKSEKLGDAR